MSDDFDRLMRDTLEAQAQSYEPSGDGLTRIRSRIAARRARLRWLLPGIALATAAAGVAGVLVLPSLLPSAETDRPPVAQSGSPGPTSAPSAEPSGPTGSPSPGQLSDVVTVWPYSSRREAANRAPRDMASGRLPNLSDARTTALFFVRNYVRVLGPLEVVRTGPLEAGAGVTLGRRNPNGQLFDVTTIYLVRVARSDDAAYVVVRADAPRLRLTTVTRDQDGVVSVSGRVAGVHQSVQARLIDKNGRAVGGGYDGAAGADRAWKVVVGTTDNPVPTGSYAVVAQTASDADGFISELAVRAYDQP